MSRTYRKRLPGYSPGERHYEQARERHFAGIHPGNFWSHLKPGYDFRKNHWMHGRDSYGAKIAIGEPNHRSPKGYGYDEVWGLKGKRTAKKAVSRIHRRRAKDTIRGYMKGESSDSPF